MKDSTKTNIINSSELDTVFTSDIQRYLRGEIDDKQFGLICEKLEAEPEHHYMKYKAIVYEGADIGYYLSQKNHQKIKDLKSALMKLFK